MNIILGSGLNALLARHILGSDYKFITAGPSRFYGVNPAAADNFIYASDLLRPLESQLTKLSIDIKRYQYRCCWSQQGELVRGFDKVSCAFWLAKIFGFNVPDHLRLVYEYRMEFDVYGTRVNQLYTILYQRYYEEMRASLNINQIQSIDSHKIVCDDGLIIDYDKCISTISLDELYGLMNYEHSLKGVDVSAILVETQHLNFEGFNQLFVVDPEIQFFKCVQVRENQYVFFFSGKIENPALHLIPFMHDFDLISGFYFPNCIPAGIMGDTTWLRPYGITTLGMSAQWDAAMDVSSCLHRIIKIADGSIL